MEDKKAVESLERILQGMSFKLTKLIQSPGSKHFKKWALQEHVIVKELQCWLIGLKRYLL